MFTLNHAISNYTVHTKYITVRCIDIFNKTKCGMHHINLSTTGNARLKSAPASRKLPEDVNRKGQWLAVTAAGADLASTDTAAV